MRKPVSIPSVGTERVVTAGDLVRSARILGSRYVFENAAPQEDMPLLHGCFETLCLRPGLILHVARVRDLCDMATANVLYPGLKIVAVVGGRTDFAYGPRRFEMGPRAQAGDWRGRGILLNVADATRYERHWQSGSEETKLSLTVTSEWLEQGDLGDGSLREAVRGFMHTHLQVCAWKLSARTAGLVRLILQPAALAPGLARLQLESRCLELVAEAFGSLLCHKPEVRPLNPGEQLRLKRLEELIRSDEVMVLGTDEIALRVGTNPTSLQQLARRVWGCSLFEYLRGMRLDQALAVIQRGGSVAQATEVAGYASATNFATAFRRRYGVSPREARHMPGLLAQAWE